MIINHRYLYLWMAVLFPLYVGGYFLVRSQWGVKSSKAGTNVVMRTEFNWDLLVDRCLYRTYWPMGLLEDWAHTREYVIVIRTSTDRYVPEATSFSKGNGSH